MIKAQCNARFDFKECCCACIRQFILQEMTEDDWGTCSPACVYSFLSISFKVYFLNFSLNQMVFYLESVNQSFDVEYAVWKLSISCINKSGFCFMSFIHNLHNPSPPQTSWNLILHSNSILVLKAFTFPFHFIFIFRFYFLFSFRVYFGLWILFYHFARPSSCWKDLWNLCKFPLISIAG